MNLHIEHRKDVLIITDLDTKAFRVVSNNGFNRIKYQFFPNNPINLKLNEQLSITETDIPYVFKIIYENMELFTNPLELSLIGDVIELAVYGDIDKAIMILVEYSEASVSKTIQKDLILYLLGSYSRRLRFDNEYIEIDGCFRVFYDCYKNHQEVIRDIKRVTFNELGYPEIEGNWHNFCLVRNTQDNFKPTWFKIGDKYYVLTSKTCEVLSKVLFILEAEKHKNDSTFWRQVNHLFSGASGAHSVIRTIHNHINYLKSSEG